ncbi:hypothetical protein NHG24_00270 [Aerococcaceae bacterium NML210727]|nr:hypothetical protein [Aerococcaceae bacterium NML210727]MCW6654265.1 hypothetical protein [Aerococcaceae bacterium NML201296]MCW6661039.1 hypothetical protein [Aerococcaceae bacterium NML201209]MCW6663570.1 hypothetical protein [Aerococcaceae bacterium NML190073]MCW6667050.1 hypothetical protein [Aerococcaceae bacterium NML190938]MCW6679629.1 hypothetical protein [Aerococcaceae bacterium NML130460]
MAHTSTELKTLRAIKRPIFQMLVVVLVIKGLLLAAYSTLGINKVYELEFVFRAAVLIWLLFDLWRFANELPKVIRVLEILQTLFILFSCQSSVTLSSHIIDHHQTAMNRGDFYFAVILGVQILLNGIVLYRCYRMRKQLLAEVVPATEG